MSAGARRFCVFLAAIILPALLAGQMFGAQALHELKWFIATAWFVLTLGGIGYAADGFRGAKALIVATFQYWALMLILGLLIAWLVAARFGHSP